MTDREVVLYTTSGSWRSWLARRLLRNKGYAFEVIDATDDIQLRTWLAHATGRDRAPYCFVDDRLVGGFDDVRALERSGDLDRLVRGEV